ncbi:MAG: lysophospholipid acyltransferase family protein [Candidatus Aegiribacteria sp.]|nr:lysophospholipid acyltransferase family protein [Candidatus Aegiribacteria sp.]
MPGRGIYYSFASCLTKLAGFRGAEFLSGILSSLRYSGNREHNRVYLGHLARVFPGMSGSDLKVLLKQYWRVHQRAFLGLFFARSLQEGNAPERVELENRFLLDEALAEGKGVLLLVPHFGDERMLHILLAILGYPLHVISSRYADAADSVKKARLSVSTRWHHVAFPDENPRWIYETIKRGHIIQIAPTAWGGPKGHWVNSFGVPVLASSTPLRLAETTGCKLLVACNYALPGVRYRIVFQSFYPEHFDSRGTADLFRMFEILGKDHPDQYNWMNLVIRHRETNTMARLGGIPREEKKVESLAIESDWDPENICDFQSVSSLKGLSR